MALNAKQSRFCEEYVIDLNATQAAIRAGYSKKTAGAQGFDLLKKLEINKKIAGLQKAISEKNGDLAQKVVDELVKIGFSNVQNYINHSNKIKDLSRIDAKKAAAVSSVKKTVTTIGGNKKEVTEFRLWDKTDALEKLGKHLGIFEADNKQKGPIVIRVTDDDDE